MAIVSRLTAQQKNPSRVNVFIDGAYALSLTLDDLLSQKLKVGVDLDDGRIKQLHKLSSDSKIKARTLEWLMLRPRSSKELEIYLRKKSVDMAVAQKITYEFQAKRYQSDEAFALWWVEQRQKKLKSNTVIRAELMQKGVNTSIIEATLGGSLAQKDRLSELIRRKQPRYPDRQKFIRYLMGKGYRYSDIVDALDEDNDANGEEIA